MNLLKEELYKVALWVKNTKKKRFSESITNREYEQAGFFFPKEKDYFKAIDMMIFLSNFFEKIKGK